MSSAQFPEINSRAISLCDKFEKNSKCATLVFAVFLITGIGGLIAAIMGLHTFFASTVYPSIAQLNKTILMITLGGAVAIVNIPTGISGLKIIYKKANADTQKLAPP